LIGSFGHGCVASEYRGRTYYFEVEPERGAGHLNAGFRHMLRLRTVPFVLAVLDTGHDLPLGGRIAFSTCR
jgi:hypothetical protein